MKLQIDVYHQYSNLDKEHQFGLVFRNEENYATYIRWIYFYLGKFLKDGIGLYPYSVGKKIKTYQYCNDAIRQSKLISDLINKKNQTNGKQTTKIKN